MELFLSYCRPNATLNLSLKDLTFIHGLLLKYQDELVMNGVLIHLVSIP
jgi:hypothetical protein